MVASAPVQRLTEGLAMENEVVRRLIWSGMLAATGALASIAAHRLSTFIWKRVFDEEPPE
jgi:hypothetical protein